MFVDEAGFYQLPAAVRTWAPRGETPVLRAPLNYGNLSAISGITQAGKLYMRVFEQSISGEKVVGFLRHVLREISGKLTIVEADDRLGWTSGPPGTNGQGIFCRGGVPAPSTGATARLRPRFESGRGGLELAQERRDEEPLLSRSRSPRNRTPESEGAASPQDPDHQELFPRGRISLSTFSRIGMCPRLSFLSHARSHPSACRPGGGHPHRMLLRFLCRGRGP